jgi:hypothetical protein
MVRLHRFAASSILMDFDGTDDDADFPNGTTFYNGLGTVLTIETLFQTDDISADRYVVGRTAASPTAIKILHNTSSEVVVTVTDASANVATLTWTGIAAGTLCALQIVRSGATITGYLNGTVQTGTIGAATALATGIGTWGSDNNGSFFDGRIDFYRAFRYAKTHRLDAWARLVNPRAAGVVVDYVFEMDSNSYILDRGSLGLHRSANGTPATNVAPLAVNPVPVLGIASNLDTNSAQKAYIRAAGALYPVVVK